MDDRYDLLKDAMVRTSRSTPEIHEPQTQSRRRARYLPYIILVIDEFADLIMTAAKRWKPPLHAWPSLRVPSEFTDYCHAASVRQCDYRIIKANFPADRFQGIRQDDSRTILDAGGAEQLIGKGDMLFPQAMI